jgi:CHAD domain-containing protein
VAPALPADLLRRPASEGVRAVALAYLAQASDALPRLDGPEDGDALHDFRVAVRRLRSTLRAYRPQVAEAVTRRQRRRLRDLADRTNAGRDADVQLAWLRGLGQRLEPQERHGLRWLVERLEARRAAEFAETLAEVRTAFPRLAHRLRRRLEEYRARVAAANGPAAPRFGPVAGEALAEAAAEFGDRLAAVRDPGDAAAAHAARIAAKRVRYVLEPVADRTAGGPSLVRRLKSLQDLLGELNDCHVLEAEVGAAVAEHAAVRARRLLDVALTHGRPAVRREGPSGRDPRTGLIAVARLLRARRRELFDRLEEEWLADGGTSFRAQLAAVAADLRATRARPQRLPGRPAPRRPAGRRRTGR